MNRKTAHIDIRVEPELIGRIEDWIDQQRVPPTFSAAIVHMIEDFLDREEERGGNDDSERRGIAGLG